MGTQILKMDHLKQAEASQSPMVSTGGDKRPKKTYRRMIHLAIRNMHEKQGSSKQAIVNHITDNYQLGRGSINRINRALALMTTDNSLVKLDGAAGPLFKVNETKTIMPSTGCKKRRRRRPNAPAADVVSADAGRANVAERRSANEHDVERRSANGHDAERRSANEHDAERRSAVVADVRFFFRPFDPKT